MADTILGNTSSTQVLAIGTSASSAIDFIGDTDWWKVSLVYGYRYQVWIEGYYENKGSLVDPFLSVYSGNGTFAFSNDDAAALNFYSYSYVTPSSTGYLFLGASESGNNAVGTYTITIWQDELASTASAATIAVNSISDLGHIGWQGDTSDWYKVTLTAGVQYQFDLIGSAADGAQVDLSLFDPFLVLRNSDGAAIVENDESGIDHNARIFYTPTTTGTYYLDAQEYGNNAYGTYRLIVNAAPTAGSLTLGTSQSGALTSNGEVNLYSVTLTAGVSYGFSVDGDTLLDPYLEILNSSGATVYTNDDGGPGLNALLVYKPTTTGTYYLAARESGNNATGTYKVQAWQLPSISIADATITEGNSGSSNLNFAITLSAPSPVDISVDVATSGTSTGTNSVDFTPASRTITIAAGQTSASFSVAILGDTQFEPAETFQVSLSNPVNVVLDDADAFGLILDNDNPYDLPDDSLVRLQWYLYPTTGINVFPVWKDYTGRGVRVAVFDQGIDPNHADLNDNLLISLGRKASDLSFGGSPVLSTDNHGTMVAGTIAAEQNDQGMVGVAYGSKLVSIYNQLTIGEIPNAFTYAQNFDVLNNSWGFAPQGTSYYALHGNWAFSDNFLNASFASAGTALENLATKGRKGLGTVVVQSAGNSFSLGDDTNLHNFQNSQFIITVAATDYSGNVTSYSSPGASVLVAAPGGGGTNTLSDLLTADRVGALGESTSDYTFTRGTSFSAPIVSGVIALMLEANPNLGYRDVQEILAYSAREVSSTSNDWRYNGASNWNGGGLHFDALSHDLGYGLVDALAAVRLAETWSNTSHTVTNREQVTTTHTVAKTIPDGGGINAVSNASDSIVVTKAIDVERAEVNLNVTHPFIGDLSILLTSPSGVTSFLLWRPQQNALSAYGTNQDNIHFTFDTVLNWGESSIGNWTLTIYDNARGDVGTFDSWTLNLIGKTASADDTYIYTNEFSEATADQSARSTLTDTGGTDTLNASAVTENLVLNLAPGGVSNIDGRSLTLSAGTLIENAYGGDGNDIIRGNDAGNILYGMRGADSLDGGSGVDSLLGGQGDDVYWVDNVGDVITEELNEGHDTIRSKVSFTLPVNIEDMVLEGSTSINAIGNAFDNELWGNDGANSLDGGDGNDVLYGGLGNDTFDWTPTMRGGNDTMYGGAGNDTYVISGDDQVIELASEGVDLIWVQQSYSLIALPYVENLFLMGTAVANLTGNDGANHLAGNSANNELNGRAGNDSLDGGVGIDTAVFSASFSQYTLTPIATGWVIAGTDGSDTLTNIEFAKFPDQILSLSNFAPTGTVTISGIAAQGQTLTASNTLVDIDGIPLQGIGSIAYQWKLNGIAIQRATNSSLSLTQSEVGGVITVVASYTDIHGNVESVSSNATVVVLNVNDAPTGSVAISGIASQGQTLTVANTLADADGLGAISYQWKADGINISGANNSALVLSQAHVGKLISVVASYTDAGNTAETVSSSSTNAVVNVNDAPTGSVVINGDARQGQTLTAVNNLADIDGMGTISYQWKADGVNITGATASTLTLSREQVGKVMTVLASYTDGGGTAESVSSSSTTAVLPAAALIGQIYQWKSHTLLSSAEVSVTGLSSSAVSNNAKPLYELKNLIHNTATHEVTLELWLNPSASVNAIDFSMQNVEGQALSFAINSTNLTGWNVADAPDQKGGLAIAGYTLSNLVSNSLQLGTITFKSTESSLVNHLNLVSGSATGESVSNQQKLVPYTALIQQKLGTTNASGAYSIAGLDQATYSIDASLPLTSFETGSAISSADALAALKIAVGRNPNLDGSAISPYQLIAADVNQDGKVTSADALAILKMAVKRTDAPVREWLFVSESQDFWDESANNGQGGLTISRTNVSWNKDPQATVTQDTTVNLLAVLKGDVNGSWTGATGTQSLPSAYFSDLVKKGLGPLSTWGVVAA